MSRPGTHETKRHSSRLRFWGTVGLVGSLLPPLADVLSWWLARSYSPIRQSISALAVGPSSWLIDLGLWAFTLSCLAVAIGAWAWRPGGKPWGAALVSLALVGAAVGVVAFVNEYAGTQNFGADVHSWAVYALAVFFALATLLAVPGLWRVSRPLAGASLGIGLAWLVLCPVYYFLVPNDWSGAVERLLALLMLAWLCSMSVALLHHRREEPKGRRGHIHSEALVSS